MRQGLSSIVSGRVVKPSIMDAKASTCTELENIATWEYKADKAGWRALSVGLPGAEGPFCRYSC